MFGATMVGTFSDLAAGGSADEAIPSVSDFFCVPSPQELLDGKGISEPLMQPQA